MKAADSTNESLVDRIRDIGNADSTVEMESIISIAYKYASERAKKGEKIDIVTFKKIEELTPKAEEKVGESLTPLALNECVKNCNVAAVNTEAADHLAFLQAIVDGKNVKKATQYEFCTYYHRLGLPAEKAKMQFEEAYGYDLTLHCDLGARAAIPYASEVSASQCMY